MGSLDSQARMVQFMIQYRKFINYFVEQSLINGLWSNFAHNVIALASIIIARFEMQDIDKVRWKVKKVKSYLKLKNAFNERLSLYKNVKSASLRECITQIYAKVYEGADFPFPAEEEQQIIITQTNMSPKKRNKSHHLKPIQVQNLTMPETSSILGNIT